MADTLRTELGVADASLTKKGIVQLSEDEDSKSHSLVPTMYYVNEILKKKFSGDYLKLTFGVLTYSSDGSYPVYVNAHYIGGISHPYYEYDSTNSDSNIQYLVKTGTTYNSNDTSNLIFVVKRNGTFAYTDPDHHIDHLQIFIPGSRIVHIVNSGPSSSEYMGGSFNISSNNAYLGLSPLSEFENGEFKVYFNLDKSSKLNSNFSVRYNSGFSVTFGTIGVNTTYGNGALVNISLDVQKNVPKQFTLEMRPLDTSLIKEQQ